MPFSAEHVQRVKNFNCGDLPFATEISDYIKAGPKAVGALLHLSKKRASIWLYVNQAGALVGFASFGSTKTWPWPTRESPLIITHHILACGIAREFQGQPPGPSNERYSSQIMDDLIAEARAGKDSELSPIITLFVHPENAGAIKVYQRAGFDFYEHTYEDKPTSTVYRGMALRV